MAEVVKIVLALSLLCAVSGFVLSNLKAYTKPRIETQILTYEQRPALERIFADAENDPVAERHIFTIPETGPVTVFPIRRRGALAGVALEGFGKGYGGDVGIMVGIDLKRDALLGVSTTKMQETPGIGARIAEPGFTGQFAGLSFDQARLRRQGGAVDAVSGATVSSAAALEAVQRALRQYGALKPEIIALWAPEDQG